MSLEDIDPEFLFGAVLALAFILGAVSGAALAIIACAMSARDRRRMRQKRESGSG